MCPLLLQLMLSKVLLLGTKTQTIVGRPVVPKSAVFAVVEEHVRNGSGICDVVFDHLFWMCSMIATYMPCSTSSEAAAPKVTEMRMVHIFDAGFG